MIKRVKKKYFHDVFSEIRDDYKEVFRVAKKLLFNEKQSPFPEAPDDKILGNLFNDFFIGKIEKICLELESCPKIPKYIESSYQTNSYFENFAVLTEMDVRKLVNKSATKSCELDPISTHFFKQHLDVFIPLITKIVNTSLQTGQFPNTLKSATVRPLLKKQAWASLLRIFIQSQTCLIWARLLKVLHAIRLWIKLWHQGSLRNFSQHIVQNTQPKLPY